MERLSILTSEEIIFTGGLKRLVNYDDYLNSDRGYIKLNKYYLNPIVYRMIKTYFKEIDDLISGTKFYFIDKNGYLKEDIYRKEGQYGLEFLYTNWNKIKIPHKNTPKYNTISKYVESLDRKQIFINKFTITDKKYLQNNIEFLDCHIKVLMNKIYEPKYLVNQIQIQRLINQYNDMCLNNLINYKLAI